MARVLDPMDAKFQRRVQRYGWDRAVGAYEQGWQAQLAPAHDLMLDMAAPQPGERVLDVACGTGLVSLRIAAAVGEYGFVVGTDISERMVEAASSIAGGRGVRHVQFCRHDAEALPFPDASFDVSVCALGLMYVPDPAGALREMRRLITSGGRVAAAVWGARQRCGWAAVFPITDARVASEVCPLFFQLGTGDTLAQAMVEAGFADVRLERLPTTLAYASEESALAAVFRGGPVALAYSRFDGATRQAVHGEYLDSIAACRVGDGYRIPGEFVVAAARASSLTRQPKEKQMTVSATAVNNGVNVEALIGAREALTKAPEAAQFRWRATCDWMNGTHSRATVSGFFGLGQDQKRKTEFRFDADHPEVFASEDLGATPM
jgi:ubiquinone/menaquinone biosynthesis C-methylase UbiE